MKKQLDAKGMVNELKLGSRFFSPAPPTADAANVPSQSIPPSTAPSAAQSAAQSVAQSVAQSDGRATMPSPAASPDTAVDRSAILGRPKAFYITAQQDTELDTAVQRLAQMAEGKVGQKIDRSTVVRLLLDQARLADPATAERLYGQLVSRLISRLTG